MEKILLRIEEKQDQLIEKVNELDKRITVTETKQKIAMVILSVLFGGIGSQVGSIFKGLI